MYGTSKEFVTQEKSHPCAGRGSFAGNLEVYLIDPPSSVSRIDGHVSQVPLILSIVNDTKLIATDSKGPIEEVGRKDRFVKKWEDSRDERGR